MVLEQKLCRGERSRHVRVKNEKLGHLQVDFFVVSSMSYLYTDLLPLPIRHLVTEMLYARTIYTVELTFFDEDRLAVVGPFLGECVPYCRTEFPNFWHATWHVEHRTGEYTVRRYGPRDASEVQVVQRILRNKPRRKAGKMAQRLH